MHKRLEAEQLHPGVLRQLPGVGLGHVGVAGASKHVAPVLSPGVDPSILNLQQQALLDAPQDTVGVLNLIQNDNNAIIEVSRGGNQNNLDDGRHLLKLKYPDGL